MTLNVTAGLSYYHSNIRSSKFSLVICFGMEKGSAVASSKYFPVRFYVYWDILDPGLSKGVLSNRPCPQMGKNFHFGGIFDVFSYMPDLRQVTEFRLKVVIHSYKVL